MSWMRVGLFLFVLVACGGEKKQGELGADCYPNGTCNVTLACVGGLCVGGTPDAAVDARAGTGSDAAEPEDAHVDASIHPPDASIDARPDAPPDAYCDATQTMNLPDGHHNAGQTCLTAGCHLIGNTGAGAPEFSYAGTLYRDLQATNAFPGATIEIATGGTTHKVITATNGNFFIPKALATPPSAAMPASALASGCPSTMTMTGQLVDNGGNCNNCHRTGGTTTPIYLP